MVTGTAETLDIRAELEQLSPPNSYERDIFEQLTVARKPLDEVAGYFGITQSEVLEIAARVRHWLTVATDDQTGDLPPELAYRLASRIVRMRLEGLLTIARECFENSLGEVTTWRTRLVNNVQTSDKNIRISHGDLRYLSYFQQVTMALSRLDGVVAAPVVERPERPPAEVAAAISAMLKAQQKVEADLEREREEAMLQRRAAREAAQEASAQRTRQRAREMLVQMDAARAARQEPLPSAEQAAEDDLYEGLQQMAIRKATASCDSALNTEPTEACSSSSEPKSASSAAKTGQKRAYNSDATLSDEQRDRRREFLKSLAAAGPVATHG